MGSLFNTDGKLYQFLELIYTLFILNLLWIICSLPIITMGASTTALYYVMFKRLNKEDSRPVQNFFKSFKANFKQSTIIYLILLVIFILTGLTVINKDIITVPTAFLYLQYPVQLITAIITIYIFPLVSRFDAPISTHFKNALVLSIGHIITTVLCVATLFSLFYIMTNIWPPISLIILPLYTLWSAYFLNRVLNRYINQESQVSP